MRWLDKLLGRGGKHGREAAEEARQQAGKQSMRPDIQAGALRRRRRRRAAGARAPWYRETAPERDDG